MKQLIPALLALGMLGGCDDNRDVRERTYTTEVGCSGWFERDNDGTYKCDEEKVDLKKTTNYLAHKFVVNRRTGQVALDGHPLSECRVVDFDAWDCIDRIRMGSYDIIHRYRGRNDGGYVQLICSASKPNAPEDYCQDLKYFGMPGNNDFGPMSFLRNQFCPIKSSYSFCNFL
jgi:hypothetical protein